MSKEAMKLALEALRKAMQENLMFDEAMEAFKALEEALAKQKQGEPVALVTGVYGGRFTYAPFKESLILPVGMALYSSPQQRAWVELTDMEIQEIYQSEHWEDSDDTWDYERAIEAKLKEKNT